MHSDDIQLAISSFFIGLGVCLIAWATSDTVEEKDIKVASELCSVNSGIREIEVNLMHMKIRCYNGAHFTHYYWKSQRK